MSSKKVGVKMRLAVSKAGHRKEESVVALGWAQLPRNEGRCNCHVRRRRGSWRKRSRSGPGCRWVGMLAGT